MLLSIFLFNLKIIVSIFFNNRVTMKYIKQAIAIKFS